MESQKSSTKLRRRKKNIKGKNIMKKTPILVLFILIISQLLKLIQQIILVRKNIFKQTRISLLTRIIVRKATIQITAQSLWSQKTSSSLGNLYIGNWDKYGDHLPAICFLYFIFSLVIRELGQNLGNQLRKRDQYDNSYLCSKIELCHSKNWRWCSRDL